jgi:hypothetical protein
MLHSTVVAVERDDNNEPLLSRLAIDSVPFPATVVPDTLFRTAVVLYRSSVFDSTTILSAGETVVVFSTMVGG